MAPNPPGYNRAYYLVHKAKIDEQHRLWYLKNKAYVIKKQTVYNRKVRRAKRAARASQKPVRQSVHSVSTADSNSPRDTAPKRRSKKSTAIEHGDTLPALPQPDTLPPLESLDDGLSDSAPTMVSK